MNTRPLPDFTPEEARLAEQLARIAPRGEPSAALDARILALARHAQPTEGESTPSPAPTIPARRPRRWPLWLGMAASFGLVAGVIWRVHPVLNPAAPDSAHIAAHATFETAPAAATPTPAAKPAPVVAQTTVDAAASSAPIARPESESEAVVPAATAAPARGKQPAPATPARQAATDTAPIPPPPPMRHQIGIEGPTVPIPPPPPELPASPSARKDHAFAAQAPAIPAPPPAPPAPMAADAAVVAMPADESEKATQVLAKIRQLQARGRVEEARKRLQALLHEQPMLEVPADLQPLLAGEASASTK